MSQYENYKSEFEDWIDMWDEAEKQNIHPKNQYGGQEPLNQDFNPNDHHDVYYTYVQGLMNDEYGDEYGDVQAPINEADIKTANPVFPDTGGSDQDHPEPAWVNSQFLKDIEDIKNRLFEVENQLASRMGGGDKWTHQHHDQKDKDLMSKIDGLRKEMEQTSNDLGMNSRDLNTPYNAPKEDQGAWRGGLQGFSPSHS